MSRLDVPSEVTSSPPSTPARAALRLQHVLCLLLLPWALLLSMATLAQDSFPDESAWEPGTGDAWVDARLVDMNLYAARYRDAFVDEIVRYHQAPRALVEAALDDDAITPADAYYACVLAQATGRPCRGVLDARRSQPAARWSDVSEQLEIALDPVAARRMRDDITASYQRWARPLTTDKATRR